ncbi:FkbM family methyltransferase [Salinarchaeum laminariae]|uniref:FkbM family methyltransferase n=1 Tax=Salinarchaeum laminariae TaxID=869888 RepID=UPI0020BDF912|nr:FkbM family methyltransferase [Salinarchaeum laminariae]
MANRFVKTVYHAMSKVGAHHTAWDSWLNLQEAVKPDRQLSIEDRTFQFSSHSLPEDEYLKPELEVLEDLVGNIERGDVFFDVGADKGLYTVPVSAQPDVAAVAFEPHPVRQNALRRNLNQNDVSASIQTVALSDEARTAEFNYRISQETGSGDFEAQLIPGDRLIQEQDIEAPSVIKIDVEGAELDVLRGLSSTIKSDRCRLIYVELHNRISDYGGSWDELKQLLRDSGFQIERVTERHGEDFTQPYLKGVKTPD